MKEKSLLETKYRFSILSKFKKALKDYSLLSDNDKVAVCISGGKDSLTLALCFKELEKYSETKIDIKYILMDPGYSKENLDIINNNAKLMNIDLHIFKTNIFKISAEQEKNKCYICAKMRRGALYNEAKKLGCNKIALGHHADDVIETLLMSILYQGEVGGMKPILDSTNYPNMKLIRPLYLVNENIIKEFISDCGLTPIKSDCIIGKSTTPCLESKRAYIKDLINKLESDTEGIKKNLFKAMSNVNIDKLNINN